MTKKLKKNSEFVRVMKQLMKNKLAVTLLLHTVFGQDSLATHVDGNSTEISNYRS